ncbi:hypothetical protein ALC56_11826 [Trachymyrmex septentrionalis]|uniref:Uncharacterized protein n=1 Tax=Trachymyrmex septentrionalis TaxID=34720 RepID=A0A151JU51_9HYME|nr:hypothetical protein ALC56_11826 [Trachymyrmex septentrionalis]
MIRDEFSSVVIVSVRRLCRRKRKDGKDKLIPTYSVLAKFQGQVLPQSLTFMHVSFPIILYISRVLMEKPEDCSCHQLPPSFTKCPLYIKQKQVYQYAALKNVSYAETCGKLGIFSFFLPQISSPPLLNDSPFLSSSSLPSRSFYPATPRRKSPPFSYHDVNPYKILGLIPEFGTASSYNVRQSYSDKVRSPPSGNIVSQRNIFYRQAN